MMIKGFWGPKFTALYTLNDVHIQDS